MVISRDFFPLGFFSAYIPSIGYLIDIKSYDSYLIDVVEIYKSYYIVHPLVVPMLYVGADSFFFNTD